MTDDIELPLAGVRILDCSQFLAGPYASLRLADLGADVIKVEKAGKGDLSRHLYVSNTEIDGDSTIFHAINRGKRSVQVNLKNTQDRSNILHLAKSADIFIQNFRPGVIERLGLGYDAIKTINPAIIYGSISGYGEGTAWDKLPGQDLLAQARSGIMWLSGGADDGPVAIGVPLADILAGAALAQGLLALLFRRERTGRGGLVETSLIEAITDLQFELLTTHLNDGRKRPERSGCAPAHAFLAAPYGVYRTQDGYLAIAMNDLKALAECLQLDTAFPGSDAFLNRDAIKAELAAHLTGQKTAEWMDAMERADLWAAPVMDWDETLESGVLQEIGMLQTLTRGGGEVHTTTMPLRIDGGRGNHSVSAPRLGQDDDLLTQGWD